MENKVKKLYTTEYGVKLYGFKSQDKSTKRISFGFYTGDENENVSDIIFIKRSAVMKNKNAFDFLFDLVEELTRDDVDKIKSEFMEQLFRKCEGNFISTQEKATVHEIHQTISEFIRDNAEDIIDNPEPEVAFIKDGFGYLRTYAMESFIKQNKELGYKRKEILERLKILGVLIPGKTRPYDMQVKIAGKVHNFYKVSLAENEETLVDEEVNCEN